MPIESTVPAISIQDYVSEAKQAYQRVTAKLEHTVRRKEGIIGEATNFPRYGKTGSGPKTRHGKVPKNNTERSRVPCTLQNIYSAEDLDDLDDLLTNVDERQALQLAQAAKLNRDKDELIIQALAQTTNFVGDYSTGITKSLLLQGIEALWGEDVPEDGNNFGVLSTHAFLEAQNIAQISSADYVGDKFPYLHGRRAFLWNGVMWIEHSGLPLSDTDNRKCYIYHRSAIGLALGTEKMGVIERIPDSDVWQVMSKQRLGACLIDGQGVVELRVDDDTVIN